MADKSSFWYTLYMATITCVDHYGTLHTFDENECIDRPAVYGILKEGDTILLVKDMWGKKWGLPGGGIDEGENDKEALIREFQEETSLIISSEMRKILSDITFFLAENQTKPWRTLRTIYSVQLLDGELNKDGNDVDILEARYFAMPELPINELQANFPDVL
jgi:8-oxo-dGTP pyrophosphatase MutT (NUDIX family)